MQRARAEKVSGSRVFANGKWLICIGNKPVNVGDLIYTDGRCVYGFYQESQQPMVITSPKKEDWGIPIFAYDSAKNVWDCYVLKVPSMKLEKIGTIKLKSSSYWHLLNDSTNKIYVDKYFLSRLSIDYGSGTYGYRGYFTLNDSNIDAQNNLYEIRTTIFQEYVEWDDTTEVWAESAVTVIVEILKNNEVEVTKSCRNLTASLAEEMENESFSKVTGTDYIHTYARGTVVYRKSASSRSWCYEIYASVEDKDNWVSIIEVNVEAEAIAYDPPKSQFPPDSIYMNAPYQNNYGILTLAIYLITPTEEIEICRYKETTEALHGENGEAWSIINTNEYNTVQIPNTKIPIQDGYYFVINEFYGYENVGEPVYMNVTIYKANTKLLSANFPFGTNFSIYKGKILGVSPKSDIAKSQKYYIKNKYKSEQIYCEGLYSITGDDAEPLKLLLDNFIANDELRAMKNYKNWHEKITNRYETPVRPTEGLIDGDVRVSEYNIY